MFPTQYFSLLALSFRFSNFPAHAVCDAVATLGGALSPFVVSSDHSLQYIGIVMALMSFATSLCTYALPETKGLEMGSAVSRSASTVSNGKPPPPGANSAVDATEASEEEVSTRPSKDDAQVALV